MENLKLSTSFVDLNREIVLVKIEGYVDQTNCSKLESLLSELKKDGCYKLIFDCKELIYLSSAGWGVFIGEIKEIRDNGGDIKIVNMRPQVYEVYQMLEFYHILSDYTSIEEAIGSFGGIYNDKESEVIEENISSIDKQLIPTSRTKMEDVNLDVDLNDTNISEDNIEVDRNVIDRNNLNNDRLLMDVNRIPIHEKIKIIISQYPLLSIFKIKKILRHEEFGKEKINIFKLYRILKSLNLETKEKRYRYWRSC